MVRALRAGAGPAGTLESRMQALPEAERQALQQELQAVGNDTDPPSVMARAAALEKHNLREDALAEYKKVSESWPDATWVRGKIFELEEDLAIAAAAEASKTEGGRTLALLVGVSQYQRLPQPLWLQYAHADATLFGQHLKSPRGGALPDTDLVVLTNEKATTAAIRNAFQTFLKGKAGKKDTVLLFIAAHGTVETAGVARGAYILTYDSDPQDLASTALPMADVQRLIQEDLAKVGRVLAFVDVCRSGNIGAIHNSTVNSSVEKLAEAEGEIFGLMASRPKEFSMEGPEFGGGHGAFSYFLLKGLGGDADKNHDGIVNVNEVIEYVRDKVAAGTHDRQHPRDFGNVENSLALADSSKPGIQLARLPLLLAMQGPPQGLGGVRDLRRLDDAISGGRLLPNVPDSAFDALSGLKRALSPAEYLAAENRVRIALEDRGQQVLLRYLSGDQVPQNRVDFAAGAEYFSAARKLTPESLFLEGRQDFCEGRSLLFQKNYAGAADLLERSARLDPAGAYSYNALGIAYLEQADYGRSVLAFRDAIRRAPYWAYPRHNLALAYSEMGDYTEAVRSYQQAMRLAPDYFYLPYNLGLLYQRLNRRKDAQAAYRKAIDLAPDRGEGYNAMGSLEAETGHAAEAERLYRQAIAKNADLLAARHNLALLLAAKPDRRDEAMRLWEENIAKSLDFLPSRISLGETLARAGQAQQAEQQYREVLRLKPDYVAARVALADVLAKEGKYPDALDQLDQALKQQPHSVMIYERIGDLATSHGDAAAARQAYDKALEYSTDPAERKRLRTRLKGR
jgi:tetratricopeptide (TPR) repeat protein